MTRKIDLPLFSIGSFGVTRLGLIVTGKNPTLKQWTEAIEALTGIRSGLQWAIGDMLVYADIRKYDDERVEAVLSGTGLKRGTLYNLKSVSKTFPIDQRRPDVPWSHHAAVASLESRDALRLLERASQHNWGHDEISSHARSLRKLRQRQMQTWPTGTFGLIYAAPPWDEMTTDDIAALSPNVQAIMAPSTVGYLLLPSPKLEDACTVMRAWGLTYRATMVVEYDISAEGPWTRNRHDLLFVGVRGRPAPPAEAPDPFIAALRREQMPEEVPEFLAQLYPDVPKVELFATESRHGWVTWGEQLHPVPEVEQQLVRAIALPETV